MQLIQIRPFKFFNKKYKMVDFLKKNKVEGEIMRSLAKKLDKELNVPSDIGYDLEENLNFDKNTICLYKIKIDNKESIITDIFNNGIPVEDNNDFYGKYGCHNIWKLFESLAAMSEDELSFVVKVPVREIKEMFEEKNGVVRISPRRIYGALTIQNGKVNLVKNVVPQMEKLVENQIR